MLIWPADWSNAWPLLLGHLGCPRLTGLGWTNPDTQQGWKLEVKADILEPAGSQRSTAA